MPRIAAAMIVRNEEAGLRAALESLCDTVDHVTLVDTGSTDGTVAVAETVAREWAMVHGPVLDISFAPWRDDFAAARNLAADRTPADCEWIVVIDGDEVLVPGDLRDAMLDAPPDVDGFTATVLAEGDDGKIERSICARAYRRGVGRYRYSVHNQLVDLKNVAWSSAMVRTSYVGGMERRMARSVPMLHKLYAEDPRNPHAAFFLARMHASMKEWDKVWTWCRSLADTTPDRVDHASFWLLYSYAALELHGVEAAGLVLDEALKHHPNSPDLWFTRMGIDGARWLAAYQTDDGLRYTLTDSPTVAVFANFPAVEAACRVLRFPVHIERDEAPPA